LVISLINLSYISTLSWHRRLRLHCKDRSINPYPANVENTVSS